MDFKSRYRYDNKSDLLGKGGFARVYRAYDTLLDRYVAVKVFSSANLDKYNVLDEIKRAIRLDHPSLLRYYDVAIVDWVNSFNESEQYQIGVMELANFGDLKSFAKRSSDSLTFNKLLIQVLQGLHYLHNKGIIHRDLKPQNILLIEENGDINAKISDFGISKNLNSDNQQSSAVVGTIEYMAPEQFNPLKYGVKGKISTNLDLWSFGIMVYELQTKKSLFGKREHDTSAEQIMISILAGELPPEINLLEEPYLSLVKKCLVTNASERVMNPLELIPYLRNNDSKNDSRSYVSNSNHQNNNLTNARQNDTVEDDNEDATAILKPLTPGHANSSEAETRAIPTQLIRKFSETDGAEEKQILQNPAGKNAPATKKNPENNPPAGANEKHKSISVPEASLDIPGPVKRKNTLVYIFIFVFLALTGAALFYFRNNNAEKLTTASAGNESKFDIEMASISGGTFDMGNNDLQGYADARPAHSVGLSPFKIAKYEITIKQFGEFIEATKYKTTAEEEGFSWIFRDANWVKKNGVNWNFDEAGTPIDSGREKRPVIHVSWMDAKKFCEWLSEKTGLAYRLPTEAEWEFASRSGKKIGEQLYSGGSSIDEVAWYKANSGTHIHDVGTKSPNAFGLYDMSGNVMEWCNDWYNPDFYASSRGNDPAGPQQGAYKILRGGSWFMQAEICRTDIRKGLPPNEKGAQIGFRICQQIQKQ